MDTRFGHSTGRLHRIHRGQYLGTLLPAAWFPRPACQIQAMWSNWIGRIRDFFSFLFLIKPIVEKEPLPPRAELSMFSSVWSDTVCHCFLLYFVLELYPEQSNISPHLLTPTKIYRFERANKSGSGDLTSGRPGKEQLTTLKANEIDDFFSILATSQQR